MSTLPMHAVPFAPRDTVRIGFAGLGARGRGLLKNLLALADDGARIVAVCDTIPDHIDRAQAMVAEAGQATPAAYLGDDGYAAMLGREDIDIVYLATPWDRHAPMAALAMENGKHVAVEVPAATTLDECWALVETSERTGRHCVMLENCCYGYNEMLVRNMVRAGLFGTLTHAEAAYLHDLRAGFLNETSGGGWRRLTHTSHDGNLYPTHGLGPVARYLGIGEGDRFTHLVSMSSREASLTEYRDRTLLADDPRRSEQYRCGDRNTSLLRTEQGRMVLLHHDVVTPRPYDRVNLIAGTRGTFVDYPPRLFLDGVTGSHDTWGSIDDFKAQYEHPLWTHQGELARTRGGHGGMDFLMNYRLIQCLREGTPPDMDVYDAATWSAPGPLSELSVAQGSAPVPFPDFTRGRA